MHRSAELSREPQVTTALLRGTWQFCLNPIGGPRSAAVEAAGALSRKLR
jgi:hypothetical protein